MNFEAGREVFSAVCNADIAVMGGVPLDTELSLEDGLVSRVTGLSLILNIVGVGCFIFISF